MTSNFPFCQLVVLDWRAVCHSTFLGPQPTACSPTRSCSPGTCRSGRPSTLTGKLRCHELPLCSQRNGQTGLSTGRRLTIQIPLSRSATCVADLLRGICIVNLRPVESPVCPFRWLQSCNSWHRSLPVRV